MASNHGKLAFDKKDLIKWQQTSYTQEPPTGGCLRFRLLPINDDNTGADGIHASERLSFPILTLLLFQSQYFGGSKKARMKLTSMFGKTLFYLLLRAGCKLGIFSPLYLGRGHRSQCETMGEMSHLIFSKIYYCSQTENVSLLSSNNHGTPHTNAP